MCYSEHHMDPRGSTTFEESPTMTAQSIIVIAAPAGIDTPAVVGRPRT